MIEVLRFCAESLWHLSLFVFLLCLTWFLAGTVIVIVLNGSERLVRVWSETQLAQKGGKEGSDA